MPLILVESYTEISPDEVIFDLGLDVEAEFAVTKTLAPTFGLGLTFTAEPEIAQSLEASFDLGLDVVAPLFLNNEPNIELEANFDLGLRLDAVINTGSEILGVFDLGLGFIAEPHVFEAEKSEFLLTIDLFPTNYGQSERLRSRLIVDGDVVLLESASLTEQDDVVDITLNAVLADVNDRLKITRFSAITFEIGVWNGTSFDWIPYLDLGQSNSTELSFGRTRDSFSFTGAPAKQRRLALTPATDLIIYDPATNDLSANDFPPIPDTAGNLYHTELVAVPGLTLHQLFSRIFVQRCGFSGVQTNLPNYHIGQAPFMAGESFLNSISGIIGIFKPNIKEVGDVLWITDSTMGVPPGFPTPEAVGLDKFTQMGINTEYDRLDAIKMSYTVNRRGWDYFTTREEISTATIGSPGDLNYQETIVTKTIREYRKNNRPLLIVDEDIVSIHQETREYSLPIGSTIYESFETMTYNQISGDLKVREKEIFKRLPDMDLGGVLALLNSGTELEEWVYKAHPFKLGKKFVREHLLTESSLVVVDEANPQLDEPYRQALADAYRGGNVSEGQVVSMLPVRNVIKRSEPLRDGRVRIETIETDLVAKQVNISENHAVAGEISISGLVKEQKTMYVFETDDSERSLERTESLNTGELPLNSAIALARRILINRKTKNGGLNGVLAKFDLSIEIGSFINPRGRNNEDLGNHRVVSRQIDISRELYSIRIQTKQV